MRQSRNFILVETALRGGCARNVTVRSRHVTQMGLSQTQLVILYLEHEDERSHPLIPHLPSLDNRSDADGAFSAGDQRAAAAERRAAGDHVTVEVSRCDAHRVTPGDFCARYGASTVLCSILHGKDHKAPRAAPFVFSSCTLRDFARTHRAHAGASYRGLIA